MACGKHQEPAAVDLKDSDGDQIQNYREGEFEKYIADFETLGSVTGTISFNGNKESIPFSNHTDLKQDTTRLITGESTIEESELYFSEWSELKFKFPEELIESSNNTNILHLHFGPTETEPNELILLEGKTKKKLGKWSAYMKLQLSKEDFNGIMKGKFKLGLVKNFNQAPFFNMLPNESIKTKTIKVHIFDGKKSKVLYVSKELSHEKLLSYLKISHITKVTDESLFFDSMEKSQEQWFQRDFMNGNMAIYYSTVQQLKENFRGKFNQQKIILKRENGKPTNSLDLGNIKAVKVYLKVRPQVQTMRTFSEYTEMSKHISGSRSREFEEWTCTHYLRKIEQEKSLGPDLGDFLRNLNIQFEPESELKVVEQIDEQGVFWEILVFSAQPNTKLSFMEREANTYTTTGQHYIDCGYKGKNSTSANPTNEEGKLSFEVESFVEKID
jgi:hypothetical protein